MAKQDDYTRYTIRIPTPLYERIRKAAREASVNAEITATLEEAYPEPVGDALMQSISELLSATAGLSTNDRASAFGQFIGDHLVRADLQPMEVAFAVEILAEAIAGNVSVQGDELVMRSKPPAPETE